MRYPRIAGGREEEHGSVDEASVTIVHQRTEPGSGGTETAYDVGVSVAVEITDEATRAR